MILVAVAELEDLLAAGAPLPKRLAAALARGDCRALAAGCWQAQLLTGQPIGVAALTRRLDCPGDAQGCWLRADPVSLVPDLNAVWIRPGARLDPRGPAVAELQALFGEAGLCFDLPLPERGYVRLEALPDCVFEAPESLPGHSMDLVMPSGTEARRWHRLLNDSQIILHQHRDPSDPAAPGSLWFWGAGVLPPSAQLHCPIDRICAEDLIWRALADWLDLPCDVPSLTATPSDGALFEWSADSRCNAADNLAALDAWLAPLWSRLRRGRLDRLVLAGRRRAWSISPRQSWALWRRRPIRPPG